MIELPTPELAIVVTGPTAGGKTSLSAAIARRLELPIISLDSMKVYRRMDIGTAKPSAQLRAEIGFEMLDLRDPWETFNVADYLEELARVTADIGDVWLLSGGTAFYLNVLREGLFEGPGPDLELREGLAEEARIHGAAALHQRLGAVDPATAATVSPGDLRRVIRALEVYELSGEPISIWHQRRKPFIPADRMLMAGVARPREELYRRIDARVVRMFDSGWVAEVEGLIATHDPPFGQEASQSIGYQRIASALLERRDPREEIETIASRTRSFARSQLTWVRKMPLEWWAEDEEEIFLERVSDTLAAIAAGDAIPAADEERKARSQQV